MYHITTGLSVLKIRNVRGHRVPQLHYSGPCHTVGVVGFSPLDAFIQNVTYDVMMVQ